jgi:hypothetical protein
VSDVEFSEEAAQDLGQTVSAMLSLCASGGIDPAGELHIEAAQEGSNGQCFMVVVDGSTLSIIAGTDGECHETCFFDKAAARFVAKRLLAWSGE